MASLWHVQLLGGLRVHSQERTLERFRTQKTAALLAYLAYHLGTRHPREVLAELLWPGYDPASARLSLRVTLSSLRRQLEPPGTPAAVVQADSFLVGLNAAAVTTDVGVIRAYIRAAEVARDPAERVECLEAALALYAGPLLPGFYDDWVVQEQEWLAELGLQALRRLSNLHAAAGRPERALAAAHRVVAMDPLREEARHELIRLLVEAGQPCAAARQYAELERVLRQELGLAPSEATRALVRGVDLPVPAARSQPSAESLPGQVRATASERRVGTGPGPVDHLPPSFTGFFGRQGELARLQADLGPEAVPERAGCRLLTLTGPGGVGKTRLALEAARRLREAYDGRVWFVPLADVQDARLIAGAIVDALGLRRTPQLDPFDQASATLSQGSTLLVLDNLEQIADKGAAVVRQLLERTRPLRCLVTSRQLLAVEGEREMAVLPLPVPLPARATPAELLECDSVRLFVDRAQHARPDFQVTEGNAGAVAQLCALLEGLPLAIELCAARASVASPAQMLRQMDDRFGFLVSRRRDVSERHRTLWAALEWSYQHLSSEERRLFARLAVFRRGWSLEAAQAVCQLPGALDVLESLMSWSLVQTTETPCGMRFTMLEALRAFGEAKLEEAELSSLRERHLDWTVRVVEQAAQRVRGRGQPEAFACMEAERGNVDAALAWCISRGDGERGLRIVAASWWFWLVRGLFQEARPAAARLLEIAPRPEMPALVAAMTGAGALAWRSGDMPEATAWLEEAVARAGPGDAWGVAFARALLADIAEHDARPEQAIALGRESLARFEQIGDAWGTAFALSVLGYVEFVQPDHAAARAHCERSVALFEELGDAWRAYPLCCLGVMAMGRGEHDSADRMYAESLRLFREMGDRWGEAFALESAGNLAFHRGDPARAVGRLEDSLRIRRALGDPWAVVGALHYLGMTCLFAEEYGRAQECLEEGLRIRRRLGTRLGEAGSLESLAQLAFCRGRHREALDLFEACLHLRRQEHDEATIARTLYQAGWVCLHAADTGRAERLLQGALAAAGHAGDLRWASLAQVRLAELAVALGDACKALDHLADARRSWAPDRDRHESALWLGAAAAAHLALGHGDAAARLLGAAAALHEQETTPAWPPDRACADRQRDAVRTAIGVPAYEAAVAEGRGMTFGQAADLALGRGPQGRQAA